MIQRGFTVVEIIITITIMGILLLLAVVNLNASQMSNRDAERVADVESIALNLEAFYGTGQDTNVRLGRYPATDILSDGVTSLKANLRDLDLKSVTAPGIADPLNTFIVAGTASAQTPTKDQYIYQPLQGDNTLCTTSSQDCRTYTIYYFLETDATVHVYKSKNR